MKNTIENINNINFEVIKQYNTNDIIKVKLENNKTVNLLILFHNIDSIGDKGIVALIDDEKNPQLKYFPSKIGNEYDYDIIDYDVRFYNCPIIGVCFSSYYTNGDCYREMKDVTIDEIKKDKIGKIYTINKNQNSDIEFDQYLILKYKNKKGALIEAHRTEKDDENNYVIKSVLKWILF